MPTVHREDEAAARLAEPGFLRRVRAALGTAARTAPAQARAGSAGSTGSRRAKVLDTSESSAGVSFRSIPALSTVVKTRYPC